jgi:hypothetical protein
MHGPINVKSPNNTSKWQIGFNLAFKVLRQYPGIFQNEMRKTTITSAKRDGEPA